MQFETDTDDISIFSHLVDWDIWLVFITNKTFLQVLVAQQQVDERNDMTISKGPLKVLFLTCWMRTNHFIYFITFNSKYLDDVNLDLWLNLWESITLQAGQIVQHEKKTCKHPTVSVLNYSLWYWGLGWAVWITSGSTVSITASCLPRNDLQPHTKFIHLINKGLWNCKINNLKHLARN